MVEGVLMELKKETVIPEAVDPRWKKFVLSDAQIEFKNLVTQLMYSRLRLMLQSDKSEPAVRAAIEMVHKFFATNHKVTYEDLEIALRNGGDGHE